MPYARQLARHLLESNPGGQEFEVELIDPGSAEAVIQELEALGCEVERLPGFAPRLRVTPPPRGKGGPA